MKKAILLVAILSLLITVNTVLAKSNTSENEMRKSEAYRKSHKITYIYTDSIAATTTVYALTKDRHVWSISSGSWTDMNRTLPTTTPAIKQWQPSAFLDARGDAWRWSGTTWVNIGRP